MKKLGIEPLVSYVKLKKYGLSFELVMFRNSYHLSGIPRITNHKIFKKKFGMMIGSKNKRKNFLEDVSKKMIKEYNKKRGLK